MILEYLRWLKFLAADKKAREFDQTGPKKTKGFTLVELVVACTILLILSTVATNSVDSLIHWTKTLQAANQTLNYRSQIWSLKFFLTQAQLNYAATNPVPSTIATWNTQVSENMTATLIQQIAHYFQVPSIVDLPSLLQNVNMHDPTGVIPDPTIHLGSFTDATPAGLSSLPTVTWRGITL